MRLEETNRFVCTPQNVSKSKLNQTNRPKNTAGSSAIKCDVHAKQIPNAKKHRVVVLLACQRQKTKTNERKKQQQTSKTKRLRKRNNTTYGRSLGLQKWLDWCCPMFICVCGCFPSVCVLLNHTAQKLVSSHIMSRKVHAFQSKQT